jgi:hypothetical protein
MYHLAKNAGRSTILFVSTRTVKPTFGSPLPAVYYMR